MCPLRLRDRIRVRTDKTAILLALLAVTAAPASAAPQGDVHLVLRGFEPTGSRAASAITADLLVLGHGAGLEVYLRSAELTAPALSSVETSGVPTGIQIRGIQAAVATLGGSILSVDLSDPHGIRILDELTVSSIPPGAMAIAGNFLIFTDRMAGELVKIDFSDPTDLIEVGRIPGNASSITRISDEEMYVNANDGLRVLDVDAFTLGDPISNGWAGSSAKLPGEKLVHGNTIRDALNWDILATLPFPNPSAIALGGDPGVSSDVWFLTHDRVYHYDLRDPANPVELGSAELPPTGYSFGTSFDANGDEATVTTANRTLRLRQNGDELETREVRQGSYNLGAVARRRSPEAMTVGETLTLSWNRHKRMAKLGQSILGWNDVAGLFGGGRDWSPQRSPASPSERVDSPGLVAYVVGGSELVVLATDNRHETIQVGSVTLGGDLKRILRRGDRLYAVDWTGVHILDISDPWNPAPLGFVAQTASLSCAAVGDYLYIGSQDANPVYDVSDPSAPVLVDTMPAGSQVAAAGDRLYVSGWSQVDVYELSDPAAPALVGTPLYGYGGARRLVIHPGNPAVVWFPLGPDGVRVTDFTDPSAPIMLARWFTKDWAEDVAVSGSWVWITDGAAGVWTLEDDSGALERLSSGSEAGVVNLDGGRGGPSAGRATPFSFSAGPNPVRGPATLRFQIPRDDRVSLRVFNVTGRLVRTLVDGARAAGSHEVQWDRRDQGGRAVAAGMYLYRLETSTERKTEKRLVVR